jgi:regulatory protein
VPVRETKGRSLHDRALGLLAVRSRSRRELERRLLQARFEREEVEEELARLERAGLVDDEAFARQLAEHEFGVRRSGARSVRGALASKGVDPATVEQVLEEAAGDEEERAEQLARSRVGRLAGLDPAKAFGRLTGLLVRRGYPAEVARRAARRALGISAGE